MQRGSSASWRLCVSAIPFSSAKRRHGPSKKRIDVAISASKILLCCEDFYRWQHRGKTGISFNQAADLNESHDVGCPLCVSLSPQCALCFKNFLVVVWMAGVLRFSGRLPTPLPPYRGHFEWQLAGFIPLMSASGVSERLPTITSSTPFQHALKCAENSLSTQLLIVQDDRVEDLKKQPVRDPFTFDYHLLASTIIPVECLFHSRNANPSWSSFCSDSDAGECLLRSACPGHFVHASSRQKLSHDGFRFLRSMPLLLATRVS